MYPVHIVLLYLFSLVAALIHCRAVWRALPFFTLSVIATTIFEFSYQPYSSAWLKHWYPWLIGPVVFLRGGAVYEAFDVHSEGSRLRLPLLLTSAAAALLVAGAFTWHMDAKSVLVAAQWRRVAMIAITVFLAAYVVLLQITGRWTGGIAGRHVLFLLAICFSFTIPLLLNMAYPGQLWWTVDSIAYGTRSLLYFTWCLSIPDRTPCLRVTSTPA